MDYHLFGTQMKSETKGGLASSFPALSQSLRPPSASKASRWAEKKINIQKRCLNMKSGSNDTRKDTKPDSKIAIGIAIGAGVGAIIGIAIDNIAVGIGIGISIGAAIGAAFERQGKRLDDDR